MLTGTQPRWATADCNQDCEAFEAGNEICINMKHQWAPVGCVMCSNFKRSYYTLFENTLLYQDDPETNISRNTKRQPDKADNLELIVARLEETVNGLTCRIAILEGGKSEGSVGELKVVYMDD